MGFLDSLLGGSKAPSDKKIASTAGALKQRHGEPVRRYQAADKLAEWGTPAAIEGLLQRFTVTVASETSDDEEKAYIAEILEKKGSEAVEPIHRYLRREAEVSWPLRILGKIVSVEEFRDTVTATLAGLDVHFDRNPQRKVELIHALAEHAQHPPVTAVVARFLDDTNDTVRIAATELLAGSGEEEHASALVDALVASTDRPRVLSAICGAMAARGLVVKGRKADVEPLLPEGFYLTREGAVKRLGR